jgi:lipopolysaccharide transport system permease protein
LKTTIYTPDSSLRDLSQIPGKIVSDIKAARELAWQLALRDIRAQYRQTLLGFLWAVFPALANTAIWLFIQSAGIVSVQDTALPYAVYVFSGTILWSAFSDAVNAPIEKTVAAKPMLAKINFPHEAIIISGIYQTAFNTVIKAAILIVAAVLLGITPDWSIVFLPLALLSLIFAGTTIGLALTPVGLLYTDISKALPLVMQFFMYLTPVVFTIPADGLAKIVFLANPVTPLITVARDVLTGYPPELLGLFFSVNLYMLLVIGVMWVVYRAAMPILIERMSA